MEKEDCRHLLGSLSAYVDGELESALCTELERHLADCDNCRVVVDTLHKTISLYQVTAQQADVPEGLKDRLYRRLKLDEFLNNGA